MKQGFNLRNNIIVAVVLLPVLIVMVMWWLEKPDAAVPLTMEVSTLRQFSFMKTNWLYLLINGFVLLFPFLLSFDRKVGFYKNWKFLFPSILLTMLVFIPWDVYFTGIGVWGFNADYFMNEWKILGLPPGEWLFFITVPYACIFIYECYNHYFEKEVISTFVEKTLSWSLVIIFSVIGLLNFGKMYTATTFLFAASILLFHLLIIKSTYRGRFFVAFGISLIPFLLINGALTGGFSEAPLVCYNDAENLSIRLISIPLDDMVYSFLMLFMATTWYEFLKGKKKSKKYII